MTLNVVPMTGHLPMWTFAERVRKVRRDLGLTQAEFSERLAVGPKAYSAWESGKNEPASLVETAEKLEDVTGVPRQWFLGWMDDAPRPRGPEGSGLPRLDSNQQPAEHASSQVTPLFRHAAACEPLAA